MRVPHARSDRRPARFLIACSAAMCLTSAVPAQDSVSKVSGPSGDAVGPFNLGEQSNAYIVDLTPLVTSRGSRYLLGPVLKSSKVSTAFFNAMPSASAVSATSIVAPYPSPSYSLWNAPGAGINGNSTLNDPGIEVIPGSASGRQLTLAMGEFDTSDGGKQYNGVIAGVVSYDPTEPARVYVTRLAAAVNGTNANDERSFFGVGSADATGKVYFRADSLGATGTNPINGNNYFRINALARNPGVINYIDNQATGGSDSGATNWILRRVTTTTVNPPACAAESLAGRSILLASNYSGQFVHENAANTTNTTNTHRPGTAAQRGNVSYSSRNFLPASQFGTAAMLTRTTSNEPTNSVSVWGVGAGGSPVGSLKLDLPLVIADLEPGVNFSSEAYGVSRADAFNGYLSQISFRGGNGPVALGVDQPGRLLVAASVDAGASAVDQELNYIAVSRTETSGPTEWVLAAWVSNLDGKPIRSASGLPIGRLARYSQISGGAMSGPSLSSPAMDSAGGLWFIGACEFFDRLPGGASEFNLALLRGAYDAATFSYTLESVIEEGDVFFGANSSRDYQVRRLILQDGGSLASGSFYSGAVCQDAAGGIDPATLGPRDGRALGGLAIAAEIVYDVNGDGLFEKVTGPGGNPSSPDQEYFALMFLSGAACPADFNGDGSVDDFDYFDFLNGLFAATADFNGDTSVDDFDYFDFLNAFFGGC
ncbi:MAG: hypothetical protein JNM07_06200 [Phycisphaerae bacterium]|nr:hypothetical protein [Phycisphaerae bacterium]